MIRVTKLNGEAFYVNPYEIEFIEETPDTVISLKSGKKVLVAEKADTVINKMIEFYRISAPITKPLGLEEAEEGPAEPEEPEEPEEPAEPEEAPDEGGHE